MNESSLSYWSALIISQIWMVAEHWTMAMIWLVFAAFIFIEDRRKRHRAST